jgi:hypothetical protein
VETLVCRSAPSKGAIWRSPRLVSWTTPLQTSILLQAVGTRVLRKSNSSSTSSSPRTIHYSRSFPTLLPAFFLTAPKDTMISSFLLPLAFFGVASAATCYEGTGKAPNVDQAWDLRQQVCGSDACANSDTARGNNHYCNVYQYFNDGQSFVQLERNDPTGQYKSWCDSSSKAPRSEMANVE